MQNENVFWVCMLIAVFVLGTCFGALITTDAWYDKGYKSALNNENLCDCVQLNELMYVLENENLDSFEIVNNGQKVYSCERKKHFFNITDDDLKD